MLADFLATATAPLKAAGFRKAAQAFHRRLGEVVQCVIIQSSHGSTADEKILYVNVGVAFDAICSHMGLPIVDKPKLGNCDSRGLERRLENLYPQAPDRWVVRAAADNMAAAVTLRGLMDMLASDFASLDSLEVFRQHRWFQLGRPNPQIAQALYLLGDPAASWQEVLALAEFFHDRQNANQPQFWIESLRLPGLESHGA